MNSPVDDKQKVQMLAYALGTAIGALECIKVAPYDVNLDGLENVLKKLKEMSGVVFYAELAKEKSDE